MEMVNKTCEILGPLTDFEEKNAPEQLFLEGDSSLLKEGRRVAVVGSRRASPDGIRRAKSITRELVKHGFIVVSGLAEGIDTVAHETAIENDGKTIAVLGTPLSQTYPISNKKLLEIIKRDHLAVSQFKEGIPTSRKNFPLRNKTMALLCDATIVVEAAEKSGTQHQAWEGIRLGRSVYIMQNVVQNGELTWPKKLIDFGAQELSRIDIPNIFDDIPFYAVGSTSEF